MTLRIREFPVAREFPEPQEILVTREFPRLKLFPPISQKKGISQEFPTHGFPLNITGIMDYEVEHYGLWWYVVTGYELN